MKWYVFILSALLAMTSRSAMAAATVQNFDVGGSAYGLYNYSGSAARVAPYGNPGMAVQLSYDLTQNTQNSIAFDRTQLGAFARIVADFEFKIVTSGYGPADGFNIAFLNTANYGVTGDPGLPFGGAEDQPKFAGSLALEFGTFNHGSPGNIGGDELDVHWNNATFSTVDLLPPGYNLVTGGWNHAHVDLAPAGGGSNLTVVLSGAGNPTITAYAGFIAGLMPYESRLDFGASTSAGSQSVWIDNVSVNYAAPNVVPLPGTLAITGMGLFALLLRRRREDTRV
jgi:hypothetical protein